MILTYRPFRWQNRDLYRLHPLKSGPLRKGCSGGRSISCDLSKEKIASVTFRLMHYLSYIDLSNLTLLLMYIPTVSLSIAHLVLSLEHVKKIGANWYTLSFRLSCGFKSFKWYTISFCIVTGIFPYYCPSFIGQIPIYIPDQVSVMLSSRPVGRSCVYALGLTNIAVTPSRNDGLWWHFLYIRFS